MVQFIKRVVGKRDQQKESSLGVEEKKLQAREKILFLLKGKDYKICAKCTECGKTFSGVDILKKFSQDRFQVFILCSCGHEVCPKIKVGDVKVKLFSQYVVLALLKSEKLHSKSPEEIEYLHKNIYYSAVFHFCTLKHAFSCIGKKYPYNEISDWKEKIKPLLGVVPLSFISKITGIPERHIIRLSRGL